jgi:hypothetical protein
MKDFTLKFLSLFLALVFYLPILGAAIILGAGGDAPSFRRVTEFFRDLITGKTVQDLKQAFGDLKRDMVLAKTSPPAPPNPNFRRGG